MKNLREGGSGRESRFGKFWEREKKSEKKVKKGERIRFWKNFGTRNGHETWTNLISREMANGRKEKRKKEMEKQKNW